jgi:hypothetical protein
MLIKDSADTVNMLNVYGRVGCREHVTTLEVWKHNFYQIRYSIISTPIEVYCNRWCADILCGRYTYIHIFIVVQQPFLKLGHLFPMFRDYTQLHTTLGSIPLDKGSARLRDLTTYNIQEAVIYAPGGSKTHSPSKLAVVDHALQSAATGYRNMAHIR